MKALDLIQLARTFIAYDEYEKAEAVLRQQLLASPENVYARELLTSILPEKKGENPQVGKYRPAVIAAPRIIVPDFLPKQDIDDLLGFARANKERFEAGKVSGPDELQPQIRNSLRLNLPGLQETISNLLTPKILAELERYSSLLNVPFFQVNELEIKFCCYPDGAYFHIHRDDQATYTDSLGEQALCGRQISFAYYFHQLPKLFSGGDLRLYATDRKHSIYSHKRFETIAPQHNSLVLFPSGFFHEVLKTHVPSGDIMNSRFAINGHLCAAVKSPSVETDWATLGGHQG
ncbi:hypothetical protein EUZ85_28685 [Hahella sp. KA22]|uniref:2OG-Fe(II) oxygenase n=1 Tax=Hahella sp. KA22 TaxID=1628392 RepID=UPI000FDE4627|nr:2OG-Fe(II) oxygenase [Hahella sp. KA22]AZZ94474.1 hypothetical protein ENC22_26100 [Hahella sp. KA22]QAY57847.1 hypothetical protein EUZ85_28685 [Hahella sp. KA22]